MAKRDYYEVLGVPRGSTADELKKAFRQLAKQYHPDRNSGDADAERRFKEINEAYEVLKDPERRAAYDQFGHRAFENGRGGFGFTGDFASSMSDIFEDLFGDLTGRARGNGRTRGSDLRYDVQITLEEAAFGKKATLNIPTAVICESCTGSGAAKGSRPASCPTCQGRGRVRASHGGFFTIERTCATCQGRGEVIDNPCPTCRGAGRQQKERVLSVAIPEGVEDGTRIRLAGEGEAGLRGGAPGDLYVFVSIAAHGFFRRKGADLFCQAPISFVAAAMGGDIEVPVLGGGRARVKIPEGTQSGKQFRLSGKGMPVLRSANRGDLYVQVNVETPVNLTRRQKELLGQFDKEMTEANGPQTSGFFARMKEFFEDLRE
jgi:molecular chaperone DnaJ